VRTALATTLDLPDGVRWPRFLPGPLAGGPTGLMLRSTIPVWLDIPDWLESDLRMIVPPSPTRPIAVQLGRAVSRRDVTRQLGPYLAVATPTGPATDQAKVPTGTL